MNRMEEILEGFTRILEDPYLRLRKWKEQTRRMVFGYFCSYCPEEIVYAAGILPIRMMGGDQKGYLADKYLPSFGCSFIRSSLESALAGDLDFLDGVVFPQTCDSIQVLSEIWSQTFLRMCHDHIGVPSVLDAAHGIEFFTQELMRFKKNLEGFLGRKISSEEISNSIEVYDENRRMLEKVYDFKARNPQAIRGKDLFAVSLSGFLMDRSEHNRKISELLSSLERQEETIDHGKPRLLLSGNICSTTGFISLVEELGAFVVYDDFCTGSRYFSGKRQADGDPLSTLARRYLNKSVCPCKSGRQIDRARYLLELKENYHFDGIVFFYVKFCDPNYFDYPHLHRILKKNRIPHILIDIEQPSWITQQMKTRLEAFLETIR